MKKELKKNALLENVIRDSSHRNMIIAQIMYRNGIDKCYYSTH